MKPIEFEDSNMKVAEHQKEYQPLPAHMDEETGLLTSCWELTADDLEVIKRTGRIYLQQQTFGRPMQPIMLHPLNPLQ